MLKAVKAIGENLSRNKEPVDALLKKLNIKRKDTKHYYTLNIIYNIPQKLIKINHDGLIEFYESEDANDSNNHYKEFLYIGIPNRSGKRPYPSFKFKNIDMLLNNNLPDIKAKMEEIYSKNFKENK
ncbi:hypothetical protein EOM09_07845, partial [bacterium]|nr:hypothetical protein [bacterium]